MANERIFLVDDDKDMLDLMRLRLSANGYEVRFFADPHKAVQAIRSEKPDLVISDLKMPGLSGLDVADLVKHTDELKGTPIILVSGYDKQREFVESLDMSPIYFMMKPIDFSDLLAMIRRALDNSVDFN